ncbi:MAG TPA: hybrid sensor histidine kinase/response regulator [Povalibacter sp.]|nr:hybrid sensor histidine kinase/response regulator [Povalibacter sp.]
MNRLSALARQVWCNYPVQDERSFGDHFRKHAFAESRIATWVAALGGTALMAHRTLITPVVSGKGFDAAFDNSFWDIITGLLLFWTAPAIFASAVEWSKRNYQWVLAAVFSLRFIRLGGNTLFEYDGPVTATVSALHLSLFASAFLRLPFQVAFCLSIGGYLLCTAACLLRFGPLQSISFVIPVSIAVGLGLFASWRSERRERALFELRERAEAAAQDAHAQARRAENAVSDTMAAVKLQELLNEKLHGEQQRSRFMIQAFHHDAKQPLVVMGPAVRAVELLAFSNEAYAEFRPKADAILSSVAEFERLVDGLGRLVELGDFIPRNEPVSVNSLLNFVADSYAEAASQKKIGFVVRPREPDVYLWTDESAARRMLKNLVSNAIKYTTRGRVFVGCVKFRESMRIDVLDSGVGIPREKKNEIYKEFVRLPHPETSRVGGQGLGLAIVAHFRDKMPGHHVEHKSQVGRGTRFSLTFPLAPTPPILPRPLHESSIAIPPERAYVVLVEDSEKVRATLMMNLHSAGYDVLNNVKDFSSASDLRRYLTQANHRAPNIVVTDYGLGGEETAKDVLEAVDELIAWESVPAIVYTAKIMNDLPFERAHTHLLTKSSDPQPLIELMQRAIRESRRDDPDD